MICNFFSEPSYFIFTSDLPELFYYSHIPVAVAALLIGFFVFFNNRSQLLNQLLLAITVCFSLWILVNMIAWTNIHSEVLMFIWPFLTIFSALISIISIYFIYVFLNKRDAPITFKMALFALVAPLLVFGPTDIGVSGFDITNCDAFIFSGQIYQLYFAGLSILAILWILFLVIREYRKETIARRKNQIMLMGLGIELFLSIFFSIIFVVQYLTTVGFLADSRLEMYGLFGMFAFVAILGYLIVKYQAFNVKLLAAQALVVSLVLLISSEFFFIESTTNQVLVSITLLGTFIGGYLLVRSVKKEVEQREHIEKLAKDLRVANERLKELDKMKSEFVSIASHQLRSPITSIRGYVSMLLEGSYGAFSDKAREILEHVAESSKYMASSIEDYLNVSRIEAGTMKYELSKFNLKEETEKVVEELLPVAKQKGLSLVFQDNTKDKALVKADVGKTRQVIMNFVDNALKYTKEGAVKVAVHNDKATKKAWITVEDTGVGMSKETLEHVFEKFVRAKNANEVNTTGTGLGLYVAKIMIAGMGGRVYAKSEGEGHGSTFYIEYPLA